MSLQTRSNELRREAHRSSVRESVGDVVASLVELLGAPLVAHVMEVDVSTVGRWNGAKVKPGTEAETLLRSVFQIVELIRRVDSDHVVRAWLIGMNPQLDDQAPLEVIRAGDPKSAMAAATAFVAGG